MELLTLYAEFDFEVGNTHTKHLNSALEKEMG